MEEDVHADVSLNPVYIMADSGARGSESSKVRQLSRRRGLM